MKKIVTKKTEVGSKEEGPAERIKKLFEGFKISARTSAVAAWNIGKILEEQFLLLDQQKYGQREKWFNESGFEFNIRTANRWRKLYKDYPLQTDCPNLLTDAYWLTDKEETPKTSKNRSGSKQKADKVGSTSNESKPLESNGTTEEGHSEKPANAREVDPFDSELDQAILRRQDARKDSSHVSLK